MARPKRYESSAVRMISPRSYPTFASWEPGNPSQEVSLVRLLSSPLQWTPSGIVGAWQPKKMPIE